MDVVSKKEPAEIKNTGGEKNHRNFATYHFNKWSYIQGNF